MAAAYSSVVITPAQIVLGITSGIVLALIPQALDGTLWPVAVLVLLGMSALGYFLARSPSRSTKNTSSSGRAGARGILVDVLTVRWC